jgi:Glycosyl hydrolases family 2, TIM barrel domain
MRSVRFLAAACVWLSPCALTFAAPVPVKIVPGKGITRGGEPYFVKGAGGTQHLDELVKAGGNSFRTWSTDGLGALLDDAQRRGLTVCSGIWLEPECAWFSYANPTHCAKQTERVRKQIIEFRDHPALLFWGLGNESEGDGTNAAYWKQLEVLAKLTKMEDPAHPTFTAVAGLQEAKAAGLNAHTPSLDFIGINTYGALPGLRKHLQSVKWTRPWVVTEYGPQGFWERPRAPWGAPLEQTSTEKAEIIRRSYATAIAPGGDCWGGYVFLWGQKQEATATWFGIFTPSGETTATRDVLYAFWKGQPSPERAPELSKLASAAAGKEIAAGSEFTAEATATDPEGDALTWQWTVTAEEGLRDAKGGERPPPAFPAAVVKSEGKTASFRAPEKPGAYRVHLLVTDSRRRAATGNFCFKVK